MTFSQLLRPACLRLNFMPSAAPARLPEESATLVDGTIAPSISPLYRNMMTSAPREATIFMPDVE